MEIVLSVTIFRSVHVPRMFICLLGKLCFKYVCSFLYPLHCVASVIVFSLSTYMDEISVRVKLKSSSTSEY